MNLYESPEFWNQNGAEITSNMKLFRGKYEDTLENAINQINFSGKVLEIGSGSGALRYMLYDGHDVSSWTHIEPSTDLADVLRVKYPQDTVINSTLKSARLDRKYDVIVGLSSMHYLTDDEIKIICDVLKEKGKIFFLNDWFVHPEKAVDILKKRGVKSILEKGNKSRVWGYFDFGNMEWDYLKPSRCDEIFNNYVTEQLGIYGIESEAKVIIGRAFVDETDCLKAASGESKLKVYPLDSVPDDLYDMLTQEEKDVVDAKQQGISLQVVYLSCIEGQKI